MIYDKNEFGAFTILKFYGGTIDILFIVKILRYLLKLFDSWFTWNQTTIIEI